MTIDEGGQPVYPPPGPFPEWRMVPYNRERDALERGRTDIYCSDPSMTIQSFTQDSDINVMMRRMGVTDGALPPAAIDPKYYGDFSDVQDFRSSLDRLKSAQDHFDALPADLRTRFANDPATLYAWVTREENIEEAVKIGLLKREAPPPNPQTGTKQEPVT